MKSCPKCKRTYADDGFTFCLEDGALLSAPYEPEEQKSSGGIRSEPPPTVRAGRASGQTSEEENPTLQPTIAAPAPPPPAAHMKAFVSPQTELPVSPPRTSTMRYVLIFAALVIVVAGTAFYLVRRSQCPKLEIVCFPYENRALCELKEATTSDQQARFRPISSLSSIIAFQAGPPPLPQGITNVTWSASAGKLDNPMIGHTYLDTTELAGQQITVKATFTGAGGLCSRGASTSFIAR